jgi:hypothetical protein
MRKLERRGLLVKLLDVAIQNGIKPEVDDAIQQDQLDDEPEITADSSRMWSNDEIAGITFEAVVKPKLPLRLV